MTLLTRFCRSSWLMSLVLFIAAFTLFTRHNTFRFYYHPDESGKVIQILKNTRNFHHPLAMLSITHWIAKLEGKHLTSQQIVEAGRTASAIFAAGAVVALALLARRMGESVGGPMAGVLGGWSAGVLVMMNREMFELAHYMKEDPAMAVGLALTFLALHVFWTRRDVPSVSFVGAAVAIAASGKYLGWLIFPFAIWIVIAGSSPECSRKTRLTAFFLTFVAVWALLNYSFFNHPAATFASLRHETDVAMGGHKGMTQDVPHAYYLKAFVRMPLPVVALFCVFVAGLAVRFKKTTAPEWLLLGFTVGLTVLMSFSPKTSPRYFLPVTMVVAFGAGLAATWVASWLTTFMGKGRHAVHAIIWAALFGVAAWTSKPLLASKYEGLSHDDRDDLKAWMLKAMPDTAVIAQDDRVGLATPESWEHKGETLPVQRILRSEFVADLGTVPKLRSKGVTHVIITMPTYMRFLSLKPTAGVRDKFNARKNFYSSLGAYPDTTALPGVTQVWKKGSGPVAYLEPGITVYDITGVPVPSPTPGSVVTPETTPAPAAAN